MSKASIARIRASAAPVRRKAAVHLREARFDDYAQIAALEAANKLEIKGYQDWIHLWLGNPLYRELQPDWPIGWVLENEQRQIVGSIGNIPLLLEMEGKRVLAASGRGWTAAPEYRGTSFILLDSVVNQPGVDLYLNNTAGASALASVLAFECLPVPVGRWDESAFWIANYRGFARSYVAARRPGLMALAPALAAPIRARDWIARKRLPAAGDEIRTCRCFDGRFDDFWETLRARHPRVLLAVRTREMLQWHFQPAIDRNELWIAIAPDGPGIAAYAIFDRKDNPVSGLKRMRLVDYQSLDGTARWLGRMFSWAFERCRSEGIHVLECTGRWLEDGEFAQAYAPYRRKLSNWTFFYRTRQTALREKLRERAAWSPSLFDGDSSL